ncbi:helix-turn-helix domain-containing protein [Microlunatus ginsengisoli]
MTNYRLRGAMLNAGLTASALAAAVQVDPKSVTRWISEDRMPYPVTRTKVAQVLQQEETLLWPSLLEDAEACAVAASEIERVWPMRSSIRSETWHALFSRVTEELDILVYAGAFLIETLDLADVLEWKASKGTRVRVMVGDPRSAAVRARAEELSLEWLPQRCQSTLDHLRRVNGICVRSHGATHYASLFRFDDILLANTHANGVWACHSPVLQLRKANSNRLFTFYADSFTAVWRRSGPPRD